MKFNRDDLAERIETRVISALTWGVFFFFIAQILLSLMLMNVYI